MSNDYLNLRALFHHGIKGQKWGVRRYQNADGSLTDAGKIRYDDAGKKIKDPRDMSDEQLKNANNRLSAESQYRQLTGTTQPGKAFNRDNVIKLGSTFIATAAGTFLFRKYKNGTWLDSQKGISKKQAIGKSIVTAAIAGGIGTLIVGAQSLGGQATPPKGGK